MAEKKTQLPFTEADFVGPADRPKPDWTITMRGWQAYGNPTIKDYLDEAAGGVARAIRCAPKPEAGAIFIVPCDPNTPKAHNLVISTDHRTIAWSLYTPLLAFNFPKVNDKHKAIFKCRAETYGDTKVLVVDVAGYKVEKVDKESGDQVAAEEQQ